MGVASHRFDNTKRRRPESHARQAMLTPAYVLDPVTGLTLESNDNHSACYRCHPGSATRCLRGAMGASVAADGTVQFTSVLGRVYRLKRSDDLSAWTIAVDNVAGTGGIVPVTDPGPLPSGRYYRIEVLP